MCHFADEEVLRAFEHFLFAEGKGLGAAEGNEALQDDGDFEERTSAHALGILFEAVLPVVMRVELASLEEAKDLVVSLERMTERRPTVSAFD